jgi:hypothetical protein
MRVGTESVDEPGKELIESGETVHVSSTGQPDVTLRLTVSVNPPAATKFNVNEAVLPAPTLCEVGEAVIEKSSGGGPVE